MAIPVKQAVRSPSTYTVQSTTLCSQPLEVLFAQIELSSLLLSLPSTERECKLVTPVTAGSNPLKLGIMNTHFKTNRAM